MNALVAARESDLVRLCHRYSVERLELFGSAGRGDFNPTESDVDFLVRFRRTTPAEHATRYFGLLAALQDLFERNVDLVELDAVSNPYFREHIEASRDLVYEVGI